MCPSTLFSYIFIYLFIYLLIYVFIHVFICFYVFYNFFHPKLLWVHARVFICGHGHMAKKWRTVGRKVTYSGPKSDVRRAEKWCTGQNATFECYN